MEVRSIWKGGRFGREVDLERVSIWKGGQFGTLFCLKRSKVFIRPVSLPKMLSLPSLSSRHYILLKLAFIGSSWICHSFILYCQLYCHFQLFCLCQLNSSCLDDRFSYLNSASIVVSAVINYSTDYITFNDTIIGEMQIRNEVKLGNLLC